MKRVGPLHARKTLKRETCIIPKKSVIHNLGKIPVRVVVNQFGTNPQEIRIS